ncbi:ABC transporter substrate-binding protein [Burkholderia guangdongensis]|uniref:ABC transporter substrate-binding protein n=1 Tax=Burkholderia guangdongensis TaxID=1792500 RepID=UPI0015C8F9AF|nr:ABC transporter substrate-binding protein [Burkholderia guangdongensis]
MRTVRPFLFLLLALGATAVPAMDYPRTIVDDRHQSVVIEREPRSIASISSFGADVLVALDRKVAGLSTLNHKRSAFLGESVAGAVDLGEVHQTNLEVLARLAPDLTIGLRTYTEPFAKKIEEASRAFLAFDLKTLDDSLRAVERTTRALGADSQGAALNARFLRDLDAAAKRAPGGVSAVFLWHWGNVPYAYYSNHLTAHIMQRLGADNIHGSPPKGRASTDSSAMTMETLLRLNPDVILSFKGDDGPFASHPAWKRLKAVQTGRAWRVGDQYVMSHGPIARELVLREMAHLLYPAVFPPPDDVVPEAARARPMDFQR